MQISKPAGALLGYGVQVSEAMPVRRQQSSKVAPRYAPPTSTVIVDSSTLGFSNGFFLRVPHLYAAGDLALLKSPSVAIVGSRKASPEGCMRAAQLARSLVRYKVVVMSGLAAGIDVAAHRAAIDAGGRTIAVIGMPLNRAYPREHGPLQEEIYRNHLLISPFAGGMRIFPKHFPERNRVMARLARATVIIEAGDTSGSLHQAAESLQVSHPVFISKSVIHDPKLTWPGRFIGKPLVYELESSIQVLEEVLGRR
jgi:DNA processing protein